MKAEIIDYPYNPTYNCRIIKESDFQKLVTLMKELSKLDESALEFALTPVSFETINQFLEDNGCWQPITKG